MNNKRKAGVLCHPTSLPNELGQLGQLNDQAWLFLDWMEKAGLKVWQMLPLSEPVQGLSPYQSTSAFALNPRLLPEGWFLKIDAVAFKEYENNPPHWLNDYALFTVLRTHFEFKSWKDWPKAFKERDEATLKEFEQRHGIQITFVKKQQFALSILWQQLKKEANAKGIELFGDMPIFVAYDSADVWANPQEFKLDDALNPTVVAGVPPDYFSETGQRWGNPHYDWNTMQANGFSWWKNRISEALTQFDLIRIDHFRGLEACWEIPATEETAMNGQWHKVPGDALLASLQASFPDLPLVAEDLGIITDEVVALKNKYHLPGMSVLQFGFNGLPDNPHSLAEQVENSVVYTGTHDNDTTLGWWQSIENPETQKWILSQLPNAHERMPWPMIEAAMQSPAQLMMAPLQDYLGLDNAARMNVPGTVEGNWQWQYSVEQLTDDLAKKIKGLVKQADR